MTPPKRILVCPTCRVENDASDAPPGSRLVCAKCRQPLPTGPNAYKLVGMTLAGYRILKKIAKGGMGIVYLAEQVSLRRNVALKVLKPALHATDFRREAMAAARITHPNIVSVYDVAEAEGLSFIVMEYVEGVSLRKMLSRSGAVSVAQALAITRQILQALFRAHRGGLIHRDIKPENVLLDADGLAKVADFGLAEIVSPDEIVRAESRHGTPFYVSPEQARGKPCDARTDLYATGVVLFEMLAGRAPFTGKDAREVLRKAATEHVPDLRPLNPDVPARLNGLVARMMAKLPADRPLNANDVVQEIDEIEREMSLSESQAFVSSDWRARADELLRQTDREEAGPSQSEAGPPEEQALPEAVPAPKAEGASVRTVIIIACIVAVVAAVLALGAAGLLYWYKTSRQRGQTPPTVGRTPVAPPQPSPSELKAKELYEAALAQANTHPSDYRQNVAAFKAAAKAGPETSWGRKARDKVKAIEDLRRKGAEGAFNRLDRVVRTHLAAKRFEFALAACKVPAGFRGSGLEARVQALREKIQRQGQKELAKRVARVRGHLAKDRIDEASDALDDVRRLQFAKASLTAKDLAKEVEARRTAVQQEWGYDARADVYLLVQESNHFAMVRRYGDAIKFIEKQMDNPHYGVIQRQLQAERRGLILAQEVYQKAFRYLATNPGTHVTVGEVSGEYVEVVEDSIIIQNESGIVSGEVADLKGEDIARLGRLALADRPKVERLAAVSLFFLYDQQFTKASGVLAEAEAEGFDSAYYRWRLKAFAQGELADAEKAALAERALFRMRRAREAGKWRSVRKYVAELEGMPDVPFLSPHWREIEQAAQEAGVRRKKVPPGPGRPGLRLGPDKARPRRPSPGRRGRRDRARDADRPGT